MEKAKRMFDEYDQEAVRKRKISKMLDLPTGKYEGYMGDDWANFRGSIFWPIIHIKSKPQIPRLIFIQYWDKEAQTLTWPN